MDLTKQSGALAGREAATAQDVVALIGRILLAAIFVISGWGKLTDFAGTAAKACRFPRFLRRRRS
jgi:uncharacterized membrane protein YphA (DoxX/SURF4 family)